MGPHEEQRVSMGDQGTAEETLSIDKRPGTEVQRWADVAMYERVPMVSGAEPVRPRVTVLYMTPNPLRVMAAASELYRGSVVRDPNEIDRPTALAWLRDMTKTKLQAPLEWVDISLLFEGVTRAFTHQLVRQRTAVYIQESMRFSVAANGEHEVRMPPSIERLKDDDPRRVIWHDTVQRVTWAYMQLISGGVPAEDARGLLPTNITTRVHYKTNLRGLAEHAGLRLTSQAQYEWKEVWGQMIQQIICYGPLSEAWQQRAIAELFRPVCYSTGKCEFLAETDRYCSIRERVMAHHARGEGPDQWYDIHPHEPLLEGAARLAPKDAP